MDERFVCVKLIKKSTVKARNVRALKDWHSEMDFERAQVNHLNVLKTLGGGCSDLHGKFHRCSPENLYVVTEMAENGTLMDFVLKYGKLTAPTARNLFSQIVEGVKFMLEEHKIVHRDLKCDNCFLDKHMNVKVADFGSNKKIEE